MKTVVDLASSLKTYFTGKDTAAKQAVEQIIAPVETDATSSSAAYSVGDQLTLNDVLYDVIAPISSSDALTVGTNIQAASDISTQIKNVRTDISTQIKNVRTDISGKQDQMQFSTMPTASATYAGKVVIYTGATTATYTSGQSYQCVESSGSYSWEPTAAGSIAASNVTYDGTTSGSSETDAQGAIDDLYSKNQTLETAIDAKADKDDLASISITGSTNNTGSTISKNTFFYKSGVLVRAKLDIANGATLTQNTNYEAVTAGALNVLNASVNNITTLDFANKQTLEVETTNQTFQGDGFFMFNNFYISSHSGALPYFEFYIDNVPIAISNCLGDNQRVLYPSIPVKKGMTYKYTLSSGTVGGHIGSFIPYIS